MGYWFPILENSFDMVFLWFYCVFFKFYVVPMVFPKVFKVVYFFCELSKRSITMFQPIFLPGGTVNNSEIANSVDLRKAHEVFFHCTPKRCLFPLFGVPSRSSLGSTVETLLTFAFFHTLPGVSKGPVLFGGF